MKPIVLKFVGGFWDGKTMRSDSPDQEEVFLATTCYEQSHHGLVGSESVGLLDSAVDFAQRHGWNAKEKMSSAGEQRYRVSEHRETETEITIVFRHDPSQHTPKHASES